MHREDDEEFRFQVRDHFPEFSESDRTLLFTGCTRRRAFELGLMNACGQSSAEVDVQEAEWLSTVKEVRGFARRAKLTAVQKAFLRGWIFERPSPFA